MNGCADAQIEPDCQANARSKWHKLCDRAHAHLFHETGAVHLYRLFPDSKLCGNHLIEPATNDPIHHLLLARCQPVKTTLNGAANRIFQATFRVALERPIDFRDESLGLDWFGEKIDGAGLHCSHTGLNVTSPSQEDDRVGA